METKEQLLDRQERETQQLFSLLDRIACALERQQEHLEKITSELDRQAYNEEEEARRRDFRHRYGPK